MLKFRFILRTPNKCGLWNNLRNEKDNDILGRHTCRTPNNIIYNEKIKVFLSNFITLAIRQRFGLSELIISIQKTINHEYIHHCLTHLGIHSKYQKWALIKLDLEGY